MSSTNINKRFLLPAGLLPPLLTLTQFDTYEDLRSGRFSKTTELASGFEYYYMIPQDPEQINSSPIGGKIIGVHGPWTKLKYAKNLEFLILNHTVFKKRIAENLADSAQKTLRFAKAVRAKYIILHTADLEPSDPQGFLIPIQKECRKVGIQLFIEHDPTSYLSGYRKSPHPNWQTDPIEMHKKLGVPIVFDPASLEDNSLVNPYWEKLAAYAGDDINRVVAHIHLNEYRPKADKDQGIMRSPEYAELLTKIKKSGYTGYFTFEIGPSQNLTDFLLAGVYSAAAFSGLTTIFPGIPKLYARKVQGYLTQSVLFSEKYLQ